MIVRWKTLGWLLLAAAPTTQACDVEAALGDLERRVVGTLDADQQATARAILQSLCRSATSQAEDGAVHAANTKQIAEVEDERERGHAADGPSDAHEDGEAAASSSAGGVKFRKADADSKGNERLKRKR